MNLTKLTENLNIHQSLPDKPTLSTNDLKKEFDKASNIIKDFLNNTLINELQTQLETELSTMEKKINASIKNQRPIGSLYIATNTEDPNELWEGTTWEKIEDVFLLASGKYTLGATGGEETHILTIEEIPYHDHEVTTKVAVFDLPDGDNNAFDSQYDYNNLGGTYTRKTSGAGGSKEHNNMPPFLAVNVWKRTA